MPTSEELRDRAMDLLLEGDVAGGISDLRAYLGAAPHDAGAWLALGAAYTSIDHHDDAARALARAVDAAPRDVEARVAHARSLARIGDRAGATAALEEAVRLDPSDARALFDLGVARYEDRRFDEAAAWLAKAMDAAPESARAAYARGLAEEAKGDAGAAVAAYREAVRRDPGHTDARRTLADTLAGLGEHEAAIAELGALLAVAKTDERAAKNLEVLQRARAAMARARLLGRPARDFESSALFVEGGLRDKGEVSVEGARARRWAAPLVEVVATLDEAGAIDVMLLAITDPMRAAREGGDAFGVTVIAKDGRRAPADYGTAVTLTFLREALGCPLTQASALYKKLLGASDPIAFAGATVGWGCAPRAGIEVRRSR